MKKWMIIITMVLVTAQAWGGDNAYNIKLNSVKLDFLACARVYDLSKLTESIDQAFSMPENNNSNKLGDCEAKLDEYIEQAANGDDAVNNGLMSIIRYMATDESSNKKIFANTYAHKLQLAKQHATEKATSASGDKDHDRK